MKKGFIAVDEYQNTVVPGIYALGDVTGEKELTPVAIKAGRTLSERLFNGKTDAKMDYATIRPLSFLIQRLVQSVSLKKKPKNNMEKTLSRSILQVSPLCIQQ